MGGDATGRGGLDDNGCLAVAVIIYTIVICTFFAPFSVALFTFLKFNAVAQGKASFTVPTLAVLGVCLGLPLVLGLALGFGAYATPAEDGQSVLGSYRGIYCYI